MTFAEFREAQFSAAREVIARGIEKVLCGPQPRRGYIYFGNVDGKPFTIPGVHEVYPVDDQTGKRLTGLDTRCFVIVTISGAAYVTAVTEM